MPQLEEREQPTNFVDERSLVWKWMSDDPLQPWWDEYDDTPDVGTVWTDLRPTGARRVRTDVPGAEQIEKQDAGTDVAAREGTGGVEEPKIKGDWLDIAKSQVGSPYVWADENPEGPQGGVGTGFDCSGFTKWLYSEAFGVALPHLSSAQMASTQRVSRKNLRPGDLIFFHYSDRNGPGAADHVEVYIGNGKSIGTPDPDGTVGVQTVDWNAFIGGGRVPSVAKQTAKAAPTIKPEVRGEGKDPEFMNNPSLIPASLGSRPNLADVAGSMMMDMGMETGRPDKQVPEFTGNAKQVKAQLYRGFMDAGRPDLARMVKTKDFDTWINAEGGYDPSKVSQFFEGHGRNAGIFQFALGGVDFGVRDWVQKDVSHSDGEWSYGASPYEQARMVVRYFNLTPADIKRYAEQVRSGTYAGWG